jgi:hypothetical protein
MGAYLRSRLVTSLRGGPASPITDVLTFTFSHLAIEERNCYGFLTIDLLTDADRLPISLQDTRGGFMLTIIDRTNNLKQTRPTPPITNRFSFPSLLKVNRELFTTILTGVFPALFGGASLLPFGANSIE